MAGKTNYPISDPYLVLDTAAPLDELVEKVVTWLGNADFAKED